MKKGRYQKKSSKLPIGILCVSVILTVTIFCGVVVRLNHTDDKGLNGNIKSMNEMQISATATLSNFPSTTGSNEETMEMDLLNLGVKSYDSIQGTCVSMGTDSRSETKITWEDGSSSKEIIKKTFELDEGWSREITAYLCSDNHPCSIVIVSKDIKDGIGRKSKTFPIADFSTKNKCYLMIEKNYVAVIEKAENTSGKYDGRYYLSFDPSTNHPSLKDTWTYSESITVYSLTGDLEEPLRITREMDYSPALKYCTLKHIKEKWVYASGYSSVTGGNATLLSTEQEFCDKANECLSEYFGEAINVTRTSWENRWYRLVIDQDDLPLDFLKIDSSVSYGQLSEENTIASTIDIRFNQNDEAPVNLQEEAPDVAVVYTEPTSATEPVYWPSHIPESIDKTQLQNLDGFKLNGFWHSADGNYVYQIFTSGYDTGLTNTLHYVNLNGSDKVNAGKVVQTSSFGLILKANEDSGEKFEVLAVNNQLISDEITLQRTEDYVASRLLGTWGNDDWTYTFNSDGTYNVSRTRGDSYWGYYFVVDEANIVLTKNVHDCRLREYRIEGNSLWIDNWDALIR